MAKLATDFLSFLWPAVCVSLLIVFSLFSALYIAAYWLNRED